MSPSVKRAAFALGLGVTALGATGCGLLLDTAYLVSNKRYDETVQERKPTGQVHTAAEYEGAVGADGLVHLTCEERERSVERSVSVEKTFERQGSFDKTVYIPTAVLSGLAAGAMTGVLAVICTQKPQDPRAEQLSCWSMLAATPFAVDVGWSLGRYATAKPAKLVEKHASEPRLALSVQPTRTTALRCDSLRLVLGQVVGYSEPTEDEILNGGGGARGRVEKGAIPIAIAPDGTVALRAQPEAVSVWLDDESLGLWLVDGDDVPHSLRIDRCAALRPTADALSPEARFKLLRACPPPPPPQQPR